MGANEKQDKKIDDLCKKIDDGLDKKVNWVVFVSMVVFIVGFFAYFANADSAAEAKIQKVNDKIDALINDNNKQLLDITKSLGEIKGALNIKNK